MQILEKRRPKCTNISVNAKTNYLKVNKGANVLWFELLLTSFRLPVCSLRQVVKNNTFFSLAFGRMLVNNKKFRPENTRCFINMNNPGFVSNIFKRLFGGKCQTKMVMLCDWPFQTKVMVVR